MSQLYYYDNRTRGEINLLYDDFDSISIVPIEVKSGKDYKRHVAISRFSIQIANGWPGTVTRDYGKGNE